MPYPFRRGRTVTVSRFTSNDRTAERAPADPIDPIPLCAYDAGGTGENDDGSQITESPKVYGPYGADIQSGDEISIAGVTGVFEVDGEILRHRNDFTGREHCCEVRLIRKRGQV